MSDPIRCDMLDFSGAWAIQRDCLGTGVEGGHHPECSATVTTGLLCDCGAVFTHWQDHHKDIEAES